MIDQWFECYPTEKSPWTQIHSESGYWTLLPGKGPYAYYCNYAPWFMQFDSLLFRVGLSLDSWGCGQEMVKVKRLCRLTLKVQYLLLNLNTLAIPLPPSSWKITLWFCFLFAIWFMFTKYLKCQFHQFCLFYMDHFIGSCSYCCWGGGESLKFWKCCQQFLVAAIV